MHRDKGTRFATISQDKSRVLCRDIHKTDSYRVDMEKSGDFRGLDIGLTLKALRREREWTQEDLERESGVPLSTIKSYETGQRRSGFGKLGDLFAALGMELELRPIKEKQTEAAPRTPIKDGSAITDPHDLSIENVLRVLDRLRAVEPDRRAFALSILFDDSSLAPDGVSLESLKSR
jgi:transcriptional regulator with XRE-family HTH domain